MIMITPDIVECASIDRQPLYNLIIGMETINKLKAVLDFMDSTVKIGSIILHT